MDEEHFMSASWFRRDIDEFSMKSIDILGQYDLGFKSMHSAVADHGTS